MSAFLITVQTELKKLEDAEDPDKAVIAELKRQQEKASEKLLELHFGHLSDRARDEELQQATPNDLLKLHDDLTDAQARLSGLFALAEEVRESKTNQLKTDRKKVEEELSERAADAEEDLKEDQNYVALRRSSKELSQLKQELAELQKTEQSIDAEWLETAGDIQNRRQDLASRTRELKLAKEQQAAKLKEVVGPLVEKKIKKQEEILTTGSLSEKTQGEIERLNKEMRSKTDEINKHFTDEIDRLEFILGNIPKEIDKLEQQSQAQQIKLEDTRRKINDIQSRIRPLQEQVNKQQAQLAPLLGPIAGLRAFQAALGSPPPRDVASYLEGHRSELAKHFVTDFEEIGLTTEQVSPYFDLDKVLNS